MGRGEEEAERELCVSQKSLLDPISLRFGKANVALKWAKSNRIKQIDRVEKGEMEKEKEKEREK